MIKFIVGCMALPLLVACTQERTSAVRWDVANDRISNVSYVRDKYGLCYATIESRAYGGNMVVSIATVPCDKVGLK